MDIFYYTTMGVPQWVAKRAFASPWKFGLRTFKAFCECPFALKPERIR